MHVFVNANTTTHTAVNSGENAGAAPAAPGDPLATAYHQAASDHVKTLVSGSARDILLAYRAVLVAEIALFRDCPGALDQNAADLLTYDLADVDRGLAKLAAASPS
jgi:hypothetical protein